MGKEMRNGLRTVFSEEKLNVYVGGAGSFFFTSWTNKVVNDHASSSTAARGLHNIFNLGMMNRGFYILGHPNISTVQQKKDITAALVAVRETVKEMWPLIQERAPHLLA
jgi:glutamate-1-semialdehyde aminotransferase